ncbi:MAG: hypothetical protein K2Q26_07010 [Bdellovibrionales bacterium]|nr:hypothetical protein [Bdellovibrionales bacterium]
MGNRIVFLFLFIICGVAQAAPASRKFIQLQLQETAKRQSLIDLQNSKNEEDKAKDQAKAYEYYSKGRSLFNRGGYVTAQEAYEKAIKLDASVDTYYYEYAICLYKNNRFVRSLAILSLLEGSVESPELPYYQALNHFKLNEQEFALQKFLDVKDSRNETLAPLSAMYAGLLLQKQKKYDEAKQNFQYILDHSKDPKLDIIAERNLEETIRMEAYERDQKKKWAITLHTGLIYDENVLNIADNFSTSDLSAYRAMYGGTLDYRLINQEKNQLLARATASDIYSVDTQFKSDSTVQSVDPLQVGISLPYTRLSQTSILTFTPMFQQIYMSLDEDGRDLIYSIAGFEASYSRSKNQKWMQEYKLEASRDTFHFETTPDFDQTATKVTVSTTQSYNFNSTSRKTVFADLIYTLNDAVGANSRYTRPSLGVGGSYPLGEKWLTYGKIDYYNMDFRDSFSGRKDKGLIYSVGGNYDMSERLTLTGSVQYWDNDSSVDGYQFSKMIVMTMLTYRTGFF